MARARPKKMSACSNSKTSRPRKWRLDPFLRRERHTIGAYRPRDILHPVLAQIQEIEDKPIANLSVDCFGNAYPTRVLTSPPRRAATLTPSPMRLSPSTTTSPRLMPMRNRMRLASGESAFCFSISNWISVAQRTASTGLANSAITLSPALPKTRPCVVRDQAVNDLRGMTLRVASVPSSSLPMSRL